MPAAVIITFGYLGSFSRDAMLGRMVLRLTSTMLPSPSPRMLPKILCSALKDTQQLSGDALECKKARNCFGLFHFRDRLVIDALMRSGDHEEDHRDGKHRVRT